MERINSAVFDTGPFIHLHEIDFLKALKLFKKIFIVEEVLNEIKNNKILISNIKKTKSIKLVNLNSTFKDSAKFIAESYYLDLTEAQSISLALQEKASFFTDDLDARNAAKDFNLEVHGTVGIILRAYRNGVITKNIAVNKVKELYSNSSLFITKDLVDWIIEQINEYKK